MLIFVLGAQPALGMMSSSGSMITPVNRGIMRMMMDVTVAIPKTGRMTARQGHGGPVVLPP